jgi:hypothetical protein
MPFAKSTQPSCCVSKLDQLQELLLHSDSSNYAQSSAEESTVRRLHVDAPCTGSEIERIGEEGENDDSSNVLLMDQPKIIVADLFHTENGLFLIQNSYNVYSIRQRLKLLHA